MSKKSTPNPYGYTWDPNAQTQFLAYAEKVYLDKHRDLLPKCSHYWCNQYLTRCIYCPKPVPPNKPLINALYDEGRLKGVLRMDYLEFEAYILKGARRRHKKVGHHWVDSSGKVHVQKSTKYQKPSVPKAKVPDPKKEAKKAWREKKGFTKDYRNTVRSNSHKTWAKKHSNRIHRLWEKDQIRKAKWDAQVSDYRKWTHDKWLWD